jgi:hypothetical protein
MMKRLLHILAIVFGLSLGLTARPVDQETARAIAVRFMGTDNITLSSTYRTTNNNPAFYIFNTKDGFVIVAADDCETPIIGYSHESRFNPNDVPVQMEDYLQNFVTRIQYGIDNQIVADETTAKQWKLVKATGRLNDNRSAKAVEPLLTTKWHQGCLYNSLCPEMSGPCGHAEVGCVAVAMGQIMNYWRYPTIGYGTHSYYGAGTTLTADFGNTEYGWDHAPDSLTETSSETEVEAVATLLYHCGVSVEMSYSANGSGAHSKDVVDALKDYFLYSRDLYREKRDSDNLLWLNKLRDCLDKQRPVLYSGNGSAGHAFVCDGYDANDLLHFNWGWGGNGDGYFALGNLCPNGHDFNNYNYAIFDIAPDSALYQVTIMANPIVGGYVEGYGEYHISEPCTLTATPSEHYDFFCWKYNGTILSYESAFTFPVYNQVDNIEACFTLKPIQEVKAAIDTLGTGVPIITLTQESGPGHSWHLLKQFETHGGRGITTDDEYIYVCGGDPEGYMFSKYTMDGEFIESFNIEGCHSPSCLTYDGLYFYCNGLNDNKLYTVNLKEKTLVRCIQLDFDFDLCSFDKTKGRFWMNKKLQNGQTEQIVLCSRSGEITNEGPSFTSSMMVGSGLYLGREGNSHLLLKDQEGTVYQVIKKSVFSEIDYSHPLFRCGESLGSHVGKYMGHDAIYVVDGHTVRIYRMVNVFSQCKEYRLWRADDYLSNIIEVSIEGTSYIDRTWQSLGVGRYSYGVGMIFENSHESTLIWSEPLIKGNYDINETPSPEGPTVQKVFENGQIVIIKDGKKYTITGQTIQ